MSSSGFLPGPRAIHRRRASSDWWTVVGQTCVAAYQPKGAASLAASYVNLANPGTYDAAPGTAPSFGTETGWAFNAASNQYLTTGVVPVDGWSMIVRFSNVTVKNVLLGVYAGTTYKEFSIWRHTNYLFYYNGGERAALSALTSGILAIAGKQAYINGSGYGTGMTNLASISDNTKQIFIGAENNNGAGAVYFSSFQCAAIAIYSTILSAADVAALTSRMAAL